MSTSDPQRSVFGHRLPQSLTKAVVADVHIPLLSEGWFVAGVVWGGSVAAVSFVLFGSVFFAGMPQASPAATRVVLAASLAIGLASGLAGLHVNRTYHRSRLHTPLGPSPDLHRAVALHRRLAAGLLALLGLAGLWHAWLFSPATRALGALAFAMAVSLGFVALPAALALLTGQSRRLGRAARTLDRVLLLGIGLTGVLIVAPPVARAEPGAFFLLLTQALGLLALPWVAPLLAVAQVHSRHAQDLGMAARNPVHESFPAPSGPDR